MGSIGGFGGYLYSKYIESQITNPNYRLSVIISSIFASLLIGGSKKKKIRGIGVLGLTAAIFAFKKLFWLNILKLYPFIYTKNILLITINYLII